MLAGFYKNEDSPGWLPLFGSIRDGCAGKEVGIIFTWVAAACFLILFWDWIPSAVRQFVLISAFSKVTECFAIFVGAL